MGRNRAPPEDELCPRPSQHHRAHSPKPNSRADVVYAALVRSLNAVIFVLGSPFLG